MLIHVRFAEELLQWVTQEFANSPYMVIARETANRVHYHAAIEVDIGIEATKKRFQKACKDRGLETARGKANAWYGGIKECTAISYVVKHGDIVTQKGYTDEQIQTYIDEAKKFMKPTIPIVAQSLDPNRPQVVIAKKVRLTISEKFIAFCETELHWRKDHQWSLDSYEYAKNEVLKHMVQFLRGKFNDPQGLSLARNCLYEFADPGLKECLERIYTSGFKNNL